MANVKAFYKNRVYCTKFITHYMKLLLKQVIITDLQSPFNGQQKDIFIDNGLVVAIEDQLENDEATIVNEPGIYVSPGWVDIFSHFCDPGIEYKETIETGAAAAAAGGYTTVFTLPNTNPAVAGKTQVEYIVQRGRSLPVTVMPLAAITQNIEGKDLAEMYDMHNSGAVAFTDGLQPVQTPGLFLKALQYVKAFNGVLIQLPVDKSIGKSGLMNEGIVSTRLGLPGVPEIAEELMVTRDIELARYTHSKLHITGVSSAKCIELISQAKQDGLQVTCSVTPYHLFYCDEDLASYDTNLKVDPPLRDRQNMLALRQALLEGKIDCIATHHLPQDWDNKVCEFEYAKHGMSGLESSFRVINTIFENLSDQQLINLFSSNARTIFGLPSASIQPGSRAQITLYSRQSESAFTKADNKGKCSNNAFINNVLKGKVVGIINKDLLYLNK